MKKTIRFLPCIVLLSGSAVLFSNCERDAEETTLPVSARPQEIEVVILPGCTELSPIAPVHAGRGHAWAPDGRAKKLYPWRIRHEQSGIVLLLVKNGEFLMGSPVHEEGHNRDERLHRVKIARPFYLVETEVTQRHWKKVMKCSPWKYKRFVDEDDWCPATYVSWNDCRDFCRKTGLRLPSEAEWEYACRAGSTTAYCFGNSYASLGDHAWWQGNYLNDARDPRARYCPSVMCSGCYRNSRTRTAAGIPRPPRGCCRPASLPS